MTNFKKNVDHPFGLKRPQSISGKRGLQRFIRMRINRPLGEFISYFLTSFLGAKNALKVKLFLFSFRFKLFGIDSSLWLGRGLGKMLYSKILWVNPNDINFVIKEGIVPYIESGDWDLKASEFKLHPTVIDMFVDNKEYTETQQYKYMISMLNSGKQPYWCKNIKDIDQYFIDLQGAYNGIKIEGYKDQSMLKQPDYQSLNEHYPNEIIVSVDRKGNYLHERGGSHRLSIAKVLNISRIPIVVIRLHSNCINNKQNIMQL